jgi:hypothetical protein
MGGYSPAVSSQTQLDGVTGDHMPSHCSAFQASNRSTSVNPSFAARCIELTLAVWVVSTGSPGRTPSNQPSAAAHASAAYPNPHARGKRPRRPGPAVHSARPVVRSCPGGALRYRVPDGR